MKKNIIILCGILLSTTLFAQFDLGLRFGANYPYLGMEDLRIYEEMVQDRANIEGYTAGVFIGASSGNFGIHLEANVPMQDFSFHRIIDGDPLMDVMSDIHFDYRYLNAVLMARYEMNLLIVKPYVGAGINVGLPIVDLIDGNESVDLNNFDVSQLGFAFSVGLVVLDFVDVDIRYITGITDLVTNELLTTDPNFGEQVRLSFGIHIY